MKDEIIVFDTSKFKQKKITGQLKADDSHGQFSFQERAISQPFVSSPFDVHRPEAISQSNNQISNKLSNQSSNSQYHSQHSHPFNATNQTRPFELIAGHSIPPLTRIGSDSSSRSSSSSLSKRKPVGNLTPTKFEYLTRESPNSATSNGGNSPRHSSQFDLQRSSDAVNPVAHGATHVNGPNGTGQFNELSKVQSNSLHSIRSPNLIPLSSPSGSSNEDSSNRSSPDLANQRSHHLTAYLNKHNAFGGKSPDYSSSNHLFDSIQHLDIQKLISSDKRKLFCSTSTLPTASCSTSTLIPKNAK